MGRSGRSLRHRRCRSCSVPSALGAGYGSLRFRRRHLTLALAQGLLGFGSAAMFGPLITDSRTGSPPARHRGRARLLRQLSRRHPSRRCRAPGSVPYCLDAAHRVGLLIERMRCPMRRRQQDDRLRARRDPLQRRCERRQRQLPDEKHSLDAVEAGIQSLRLTQIAAHRLRRLAADLQCSSSGSSRALHRPQRPAGPRPRGRCGPSARRSRESASLAGDHPTYLRRVCAEKEPRRRGIRLTTP